VTAISVEVDPRQLAALERMLGGVRGGLPRVAARAVNKVARGARTRVVRAVAGRVAVKQGELRRRNVTLKTANYKHLSAHLRISGARIPVIRFGARQTRRGVSYRIEKRGSRRKVRRAFIATMRSGHRGVFTRDPLWEHRYPRGRSSGRKHGLPITELRGPSVPEDAQLQEAMARVGGHLVDLSHRHRAVRFLKEGVRLNLGSIGKGYALDRCAEALAAGGVHDFLLHAGGSSIVARGDCLADPPGWIVGIPHPLRPKRRLAELRLVNQALATSGSRFQSFVHEGRRVAHVVDPRTGQPVEGVFSATAITFDAATADALSTAFFVLGTEGTRQYCASHPDTGAVLCTASGREGGYALHQFGLSSASFRLLDPPAGTAPVE